MSTDLRAEPDDVGLEGPGNVGMDKAVDVLRLLADRTRLEILVLLSGGEQAVGAIAAEVGRPVPGVSQHLAKLRSGRLVTTRREGTTIFYSLSSEHVEALVTNVIQHSEHMTYEVPPHHR
ncbi:ArsR/SmtB family transcription factor [Sanguibacter gelidistatuariae]|nr:metalloregulator ArsR/SmtB family transcription factor [Sanguibacter gelidistatuariae]